MDRNKAHDLLHMWNGGKSEQCPVCTGACTSDEEIVTRAMHLAAEIAKPTISPNVPYEATVFASEEGTKDETAIPPVEASPAPEAQGKEEAPAETVKASEKKVKRLDVMTDVMSFSEGKSVPEKIKIIPAGKFNTSKYGELEITKEMLEQMRQNFHAGVRAGGSLTGLPIDIEHGETSYRDAAAGWMKDIEVYDDGAYAKVEWTSLGEDLLSKGLYKFFSPEFTFDYVSNETSTYFANVVTGGGLVNKPLFDHSLPPVMASEGDNAQNLTTNSTQHTIFISNMQSSADMPTPDHTESVLKDSKKEQPMDLQTILAKEKSARTSEEQAFVASNLGQLSEDQKKAEGFLASEEVKTEEVKEETPAETKVEEKVEAPAETAPVEPAPTAPVETVTASEKPNQVVITASEYSKMREELDTFKAAAERTKKELEKKEITEQVRSLTFSEKGGKLSPAQADQAVDLMLSMGEAQRTQFTEFLKALPETGKMLFGENGSDLDITASQAVDARIAELKTQGMSFSDAIKTVAQENPEGYKAYQAASLQPVAR